MKRADDNPSRGRPGAEVPALAAGSTQPYAATGLTPLAGGAELARVLEAFLAELEAGRAPDRARLLADYPHLAPELEEALAGLEFIHRAAAPADKLAPVQLGDFRILREIGRGGMGVVYEAEQVSLKRRVALKVLRFGPVADPVAMQRFQREAETIGGLHHTNIVPIFAIGADEGVRYYAMQFIEGRDLGRVAKELPAASAPVDFRRIADWGLQAADALAHAHQRGVIHRDIKPSNLILDADNRIWLTDFGLARRVDDASLSLTGALLGTPRYMSPEQAAARQTIDHRTDLYSLGATLYELVTGRPIFQASSAHEVLSQILHHEPAPPRSLVSEIPRDLETVILKCLAKTPAHRYGTAQELTEDLRAFVAGRAIAARRPRVLERGARWFKQHRRMVLTASSSSLLAVLLAAGGVSAWRAYATARMGQLRLSSTTPGAVAEILDEQGRTLLPLFPIPNEQPVSIPPGSYRVRVCAPGQLSETWPLDVSPKETVSTSLDLKSRWLWKPQEIVAAPALEVVPFEGRTAILALQGTDPEPGPAGRPARLRLLDGAQGKGGWPADLEFDASTLPGGSLEEWKQLLVHWAVAPAFAGTRISERVTDLDADGARDFVFVSRSSASLLAVSGRTGRVLWWHRSRPSLPDGAPADGRWNVQLGQSFVVSFPAVFDVDDDGIADFLTSFRSNGETYVRPDGSAVKVQAQSWLSAVSGRTGGELWRQAVEGPWADYASSSAGAKYDALAHPNVARVRGRWAAFLPAEDRLRAWDARTGEPLSGAWPTGFAIEFAPLFLGAPGNAPAIDSVLLRRRFVRSDAHLERVVMDLNTGAVLWRDNPLTVLGGLAGELGAVPPESFPSVDLEADDRLETLAFTGRHPALEKWTFGVQVADARTGQVRWETLLHEGDHPQSIPSDARLSVGPDIDGDGCRDVFAVIPGYDRGTQKHGVLAAALSGAKGKILWTRHHPGVGGARDLAWWQLGRDGWPMLVASTTPFSGGRNTVVVLAAGSGELVHSLFDVREIRVADFDGDGAPDLFYPTQSQSALRWAVAKGQPASEWRRSGAWITGPDADLDGRTDFYGRSGESVMARSGRDGRPVWGTKAELASPEQFWVDPSAGPSGARGAKGQLVAAVNLWRTTSPGIRQTYQSLASYSVREGRLRWRAADFDLGGGGRSGSMLGWAYEYPQVRFSDLDGDQVSEVLVSAVASLDTLRLAVISGIDGRRLWETQIMDGAMSPDPRPSGAPWADFNGDRCLDLAVISPPTSASTVEAGLKCRVQVLDGRTGSPLWPAAYALTDDVRGIGWPEPTLGDLDDDGVPEVLVVRQSVANEAQGYRSELIALDGRTGQVRWTWAWNAGSRSLWPPLVLGSKTAALRRVAVGVDTAEGMVLVVLDSGGRLLLRRAIQATGFPSERGAMAWRAADLDGDATVDLVYPDGGMLCAAFGLDLSVRWRIPMAGRPGEHGFRLLGGELPGHSEGEGSGTAGLWVWWTGRDVFGVRGATGEVEWRGLAPSDPVWGTFGYPHLNLVRSPQGNGRPGLLFTPPVARNDLCEVLETWATEPRGRFLSWDIAHAREVGVLR